MIAKLVGQDAVSRQAAREVCRLTADDSSRDGELDRLIAAAREKCEHEIGRALVRYRQTFEYVDVPTAAVVLPVQDAHAVVVEQWDGATWAAVPGVEFGPSVEGTAVDATPWPAPPARRWGPRLRILVDHGPDPADAPPVAATYILAVVSYWFDNPAALKSGSEPGAHLDRLLDPLRWGRG